MARRARKEAKGKIIYFKVWLCIVWWLLFIMQDDKVGSWYWGCIEWTTYFSHSIHTNQPTNWKIYLNQKNNMLSNNSESSLEGCGLLGIHTNIIYGTSIPLTRYLGIQPSTTKTQQDIMLYSILSLSFPLSLVRGFMESTTLNLNILFLVGWNPWTISWIGY